MDSYGWSRIFLDDQLLKLLVTEKPRRLEIVVNSSSNERPDESPDQPWLVYKKAMVVVAHPDDA